MSASEDEEAGIATFLAQIAAVVRWVLDASIDAVCVACLVAALCCPWHLLPLTRALRAQHSFGRTYLRDIAPRALCVVVLDCVAVPCALASPTRWRECSLAARACATKSHDVDPKRYRPDLEVRCSLCLALPNGVIDLVCAAAGLVALVAPFRCAPLVLGLRRHVADTRCADAEDCRHRASVLRLWALECGAGAVVDLLLLPFAALPLLVPTRCVYVYRAHAFVVRDLLTRAATRDTDWWLRADVEWPDLHRSSCDLADYDVAHSRLYAFWLRQAAYALLDLVAVPCGFVCLCSVVRTRALWFALKRSAKAARAASCLRRTTIRENRICAEQSDVWGAVVAPADDEAADGERGAGADAADAEAVLVAEEAALVEEDLEDSTVVVLADPLLPACASFNLSLRLHCLEHFGRLFAGASVSTRSMEPFCFLKEWVRRCVGSRRSKSVLESHGPL